MFLVKTFFIKRKHYILLSQLRNWTVKYSDICKNHHCLLADWIFWQEKDFSLKKKILAGDRTAHFPVLCILLVGNADSARMNQTKPITEGLYYKLLTDCTLVLLHYNPRNHILYSYYKIYFYFLNLYLLYAQNFNHCCVLQMQIKPEYHQLNYKSKKKENPKYWKATKNRLISYQESLHSMICSLLNIQTNSCCFYYLIISNNIT